MEEWRDIHFIENGVEYDYRGKYQVNSHGRVKSLNYNKTGKEKILKAKKDKDNYEYVCLSKNNKQKNFKIHRLVAHMFLSNDNPIEKVDVNHIDENKENNHVSNLEWCTRGYNCNYGTRNERVGESRKGKYKGEKNPRARKIVMIDPSTKQLIFIFKYVKQVTEFYNIDKNTLIYYLKGRRKTGHEYNGFLWYYADEWEQM